MWKKKNQRNNRNKKKFNPFMYVLILVVIALAVLGFKFRVYLLSLITRKPVTMETKNRGIRNKNPFNIKFNRANDWKGKIEEALNTETIINGKPVFEQFKTMGYGIRAGFMLIDTYYWKHGLKTLDGFVNRYFPAYDDDFKINQNQELYKKQLSELTGFALDYEMKWGMTDILKLMTGLLKIESGFEFNEKLYKHILLDKFHEWDGEAI